MQCTTRQPGCVINNVLIGESNQLFLFEGNYNQFSYLINQESVVTSLEEKFSDNILKRKSFADERKIPYLHVVFPCKPFSYTRQDP